MSPVCVSTTINLIRSIIFTRGDNNTFLDLLQIIHEKIRSHVWDSTSYLIENKIVKAEEIVPLKDRLAIKGKNLDCGGRLSLFPLHLVLLYLHCMRLMLSSVFRVARESSLDLLVE
jgi:hypothetical protein